MSLETLIEALRTDEAINYAPCINFNRESAICETGCSVEGVSKGGKCPWVRLEQQRLCLAWAPMKLKESYNPNISPSDYKVFVEKKKAIKALALDVGKRHVGKRFSVEDIQADLTVLAKADNPSCNVAIKDAGDQLEVTFHNVTACRKGSGSIWTVVEEGMKVYCALTKMRYLWPDPKQDWEKGGMYPVKPTRPLLAREPVIPTTIGITTTVWGQPISGVNKLAQMKKVLDGVKKEIKIYKLSDPSYNPDITHLEAEVFEVVLDLEFDIFHKTAADGEPLIPDNIPPYKGENKSWWQMRDFRIAVEREIAALTKRLQAFAKKNPGFSFDLKHLEDEAKQL